MKRVILTLGLLFVLSVTLPACSSPPAETVIYPTPVVKSQEELNAEATAAAIQKCAAIRATRGYVQHAGQNNYTALQTPVIDVSSKDLTLQIAAKVITVDNCPAVEFTTRILKYSPDFPWENDSIDDTIGNLRITLTLKDGSEVYIEDLVSNNWISVHIVENLPLDEVSSLTAGVRGRSQQSVGSFMGGTAGVGNSYQVYIKMQ